MCSIPSQGTCKRQPVDVSLSHWCFSPSLPPFPSLQSISMSSGEDKKREGDQRNSSWEILYLKAVLDIVLPSTRQKPEGLVIWQRWMNRPQVLPETLFAERALTVPPLPPPPAPLTGSLEKGQALPAGLPSPRREGRPGLVSQENSRPAAFHPPSPASAGSLPGGYSVLLSGLTQRLSDNCLHVTGTR